MEATAIETVIGLLAPLVAEHGAELYDVEWKPGLLRVSIDRPMGTGTGIDLDAVGRLAPMVSALLDALDPDPFPGQYTLEVGSPGIERTLRTPAHYRVQVGQMISVRTVRPLDGERRFLAVLDAADDHGVSLAGRTLAYDEIGSARSVFDWAEASATSSKPSKPPKPARGAKKTKKQADHRPVVAAQMEDDRA